MQGLSILNRIEHEINFCDFWYFRSILIPEKLEDVLVPVKTHSNAESRESAEFSEKGKLCHRKRKVHLTMLWK